MSSCASMRRHLENSGYKILPISPDNAGSYSSSIPLILPNDLEYDLKTKSVIKKDDVQRTSLYLVPEALELLNSVKLPLAVVAICGPMRTGKSYILSRLLGEPDAFELGHRMDPQTMGIWMGTKILQGKDKNGNEQAVLLLDTEGIDAPGASLSQDAGILVLTILISSVLIYNSQTVPKKSDLEKLDCFIHLAKGFEVKRGRKLQVGEVSQYFPDFIWLLRDVSLAIEDNDGNKMDPNDYIMKKVLSSETNDVDPDKADKVGRAILMFFPDIECKTLPAPHIDEKIMQNIAKHTNDLNPKFQRDVQDLMKHLITKVQTNGPKRGYQVGSAVTGPLLCGLLNEYVEAVNDPGAIPCLDNAWQNTVDLLKAKTIDELVDKYRAFMSEKIQAASVRRDGKTYPLEEHEANGTRGATLMGIHDKILPPLTDELLKEVEHFGVGDTRGLKKNSEELVNTFQKRIMHKKKGFTTVNEDGKTKDYEGMEVCGGELFEFICKNRQLSAKYCTQLYQELFAPIQFKIENEVETYTCRQLEADFEKMNEEYIRRAIGPEKWKVLSEMDKITVKAQKNNFKKMKGYQEKVMEEKLRAKEAEIEARRQNEELNKLYQETIREREKNADNLTKMQENYNTQLKKLRDEGAKRVKEEVKKLEDLHKYYFAEHREIIRESNRNQNQIIEAMMKNMELEKQQSLEQIEKLRDTIANMKPPTVAPKLPFPLPMPIPCPMM